jgi:hypothetical protein
VHRTARPARLRLAAAVAALTLVPALSACGSGVTAGTSQQGPSGNGANANVGPIQLRAITVVQPAAPAGGGSPTAARVIGTIVNTGDADTLLGATITSPTGATVALSGTAVTGGTLPLPAQSATRVGFNSDDHLDVTGLTIAPTFFANVEFSFKTAGRVTVPVMVVPATGIYEGLGPVA